MVYAIAELINEAMTARGWRRHHLVAAMGYKNAAHGLKRLDACLQEGDCSNMELLQRLRQALALAPERLATAVAETRRQRVEEQRLYREQTEAAKRAHFRPY